MKCVDICNYTDLRKHLVYHAVIFFTQAQPESFGRYMKHFN
jgi:hypothetical protein